MILRFDAVCLQKNMPYSMMWSYLSFAVALVEELKMFGLLMLHLFKSYLGFTTRVQFYKTADMTETALCMHGNLQL